MTARQPKVIQSSSHVSPQGAGGNGPGKSTEPGHPARLSPLLISSAPNNESALPPALETAKPGSEFDDDYDSGPLEAKNLDEQGLVQDAKETNGQSTPSPVASSGAR